MSTAAETVNDFMESLEAGEFAQAATSLSDDFTFIGLTPKPLNKTQFINLMSELKAGIPGLSFNFHLTGEEGLQETGIRVMGDVQMAGTQVNSLNLYQLSLPPIPQLGKSFSLPIEHWEFEMKDDNTIRTIRVGAVAGGGIPGMLHQLGVDVPIIQ